MTVTPHTQTITLPHEIPLTAAFNPKQQKVDSRYYNIIYSILSGRVKDKNVDKICMSVL